MHSKLKLAMAAIVSPLTAFQEILERRLLVDAVWIVGLAGLFAMFAAITRAWALGSDQLFVIGRDNPFTWIGLWMLFSLGVWVLLKWMGSQLDYPTVLIVIGWAQVLLVIHQALGIIWGLLIAMGYTHQYLMSFFSAAGMVLPIMFIITVGRGMQATGRSTFFRGMLNYVLIIAVANTLSDMLYTQRLLAPFHSAPFGVQIAALRLSPEAEPGAFLGMLMMDPWTRGIAQVHRLIAGTLGLVLGIWWLAKFQIWNKGTRDRMVAAAAIVGIAATAAYAIAWNRSGYYSSLTTAQRLYVTKDYAKSAAQLAAFSNRLTNNAMLVWGFRNKVQLFSDTADAYYLADKPTQCIEYYEKSMELVETTNVPWEKNLYLAGSYSRIADAYFIAGQIDNALAQYELAEGIAEKANKSAEREATIAQAQNGIAMVYDQKATYDRAIEQFKAAAKSWPDFREPWVRMAVTYDRMGRYKDAIASGNHAIKDLGSDAPVAWVALAQAFLNTGDTKQADASIAMARASNKALADKIGPKPEDWKNAVGVLTIQDLKFPLETEFARQPGTAKK